MKNRLRASLFLITLVFVSVTQAQELRPALENGRPVLRFGDNKQCSSLISYGPLDGESEAVGVPVQRWGQTGEVGMLFLNRTAIAYRTYRIEHSFTIPRSNFKGAAVSIRKSVYYLTIKSTVKNEQEFKITCTVNPDVYSYVSMIANDFDAGTAEFKKLTVGLARTNEAAERPLRAPATETSKTPAPAEAKKKEAAVGVPEPKRLSWTMGAPQSDSIVVDGVSIRVLTNQDILVAVAITDNGSYNVAEVTVLNNGKGRILVDPELTRFIVVTKEGKTQALEPIPAQKIAGKIRSRARWGNALRAFAASLATRQSTSTSQTNGNVSVFGQGGFAQGTYSGTTTTTTSTPDVEAQRRAAATIARNTEDANLRAEGIVSSGLKANTLFPGNTLDGIIYFDHKKYQKAAFRILIEDTVYDFAFTLNEKSKVDALLK
jgi:hypothetical protein